MENSGWRASPLMGIVAFMAMAMMQSPAQSQTTTVAPGWILSGRSPAKYAVAVTGDGRHGGQRGATLSSTPSSGPDDFATVMQTIDAAPYRGKRVRLTAWLRTQDAGEAHLWLRIDGSAETLSMDNMDDRPIKGTSPWTLYTIVMDVPAEAADLAFGYFLIGSGKASADDFSIGIVSGNEATTKAYDAAALRGDRPFRRPSSIAASASNLGFED